MASLIFEGKLLVIDAHKVEYGGLEVVYMDGVADDVVAVVVGFADADTWFDATAGHPDGEAAWGGGRVRSW